MAKSALLVRTVLRRLLLLTGTAALGVACNTNGGIPAGPAVTPSPSPSPAASRAIPYVPGQPSPVTFHTLAGALCRLDGEPDAPPLVADEDGVVAFYIGIDRPGVYRERYVCTAHGNVDVHVLTYAPGAVSPPPKGVVTIRIYGTGAPLPGVCNTAIGGGTCPP